jgi:HEAT repeat protein
MAVAKALTGQVAAELIGRGVRCWQKLRAKPMKGKEINNIRAPFLVVRRPKRGGKVSLGWQSRTILSVLLIAVCLTLGNSGWAAKPPMGLPHLPSRVLPDPSSAAEAELKEDLALLASANPTERAEGRKRLERAGQDLLPAMAKTLRELRKSAPRKSMSILITKARKLGKEQRREEKKASKKNKKKSKSDKDSTKEKARKSKRKKKSESSNESGDWLDFVLEAPEPNERAYRDLVAVLGIERALVAMGNTPAVREIINVYFYFGKLFRIDVQHMLDRLGDKAVPALIEARHHESEMVRTWAARRLDVVGKAIPGEAVQTEDIQQLASVLRAYGYTKEIDALRVLISFTASEEKEIRDAARQALAHFGDAAKWRLRESYKNLTGKRAPSHLTWHELLRALFRAHDEARMAEIVQTYEKGTAALKENKLEEAVTAFDFVLAREPVFDERVEMAPAYWSLAQQVENKDKKRAILLARKALHIQPDHPDAKKIQSHVFTLLGEIRMEQGIPDAVPFKRALLLDENNQRAKQALAKLEREPIVRNRPAPTYRFLAAGVIGVLALLMTAVLGFLHSRKRKDVPDHPTVPEGLDGGLESTEPTQEPENDEHLVSTSQAPATAAQPTAADDTELPPATISDKEPPVEAANMETSTSTTETSDAGTTEPPTVVAPVPPTS